MNSISSTNGLNYWPLATVRCWGEEPWGTYKLMIRHTLPYELKGKLVAWQLALHGSPLTTQDFAERKK